LDGDTLIEKPVYSFTFSYTETITGEAYADTPEEITEGLSAQFGNLPGFTISEIKLFVPTIEEEQMSFDLKTIN
jgi:hypothetical protein